MRTQELYSEIVKQLEKLDESSSSEARLRADGLKQTREEPER